MQLSVPTKLEEDTKGWAGSGELRQVGSALCSPELVIRRLMQVNRGWHHDSPHTMGPAG